MTLKHRIRNAAARWAQSRRKGPQPTLHCSFCSKSEHEVAQLIAGPCVFICNECVAICTSVIDAETRKGSGGAAPASPSNEAAAPEPNEKPGGETPMIGDIRSMPTERLLGWLKFQEGLFAQSRDALQDAVDILRQREVSWAAIGEALGVSRQAAWDRFS